MIQKNNRSGHRENAGRPSVNRDMSLTVRISQEASQKLKTVDNKSNFIDAIILKSL